MRKWHRWLVVFFGAFLLWISITGLLSQVVPWFLPKPDRAAAAAQVPAGFVCPETMNCRPKPPKGGSIIGTLHHLHSGESFGPVGVAIATLSGLAMVFFTISGIWMYVQMWANRRDRKLRPGLFWK
ncbi:PepSY domain-containing protein [Novosphingobium piscinae]|uniref:PepSY domain-containing protein n=1 Tax=Novosphingobium piscinae TaxID=1507448 RepID=A0A7X1FZQ1_9SPHN|nr:PepSY domain-containing protein [Novosphingobium piscinae]MBC2669322.1 PepSY domain-containing protein [Novosphingobium piscinae]